MIQQGTQNVGSSYRYPPFWLQLGIVTEWFVYHWQFYGLHDRVDQQITYLTYRLSSWTRGLHFLLDLYTLRIQNGAATLWLLCCCVLYMRHLLHVCPSEGEGSVLCGSLTGFLLFPDSFHRFRVLKLFLTRWEGLRTEDVTPVPFVKPPETSCNLWFWAIQK